MCWCQQFLPHVKGPLFLTLGLDAPLASRPECSWMRTNSPSLFLSLSLCLSLSSSPLLSRKQKAERVGQYKNASSHPCPVHPTGGYWGLTANHWANCWDPEASTHSKERGSELVHFFMLCIGILLQVRCSHSNFGCQFLYFYWLILKYSLKKRIMDRLRVIMCNIKNKHQYMSQVKVDTMKPHTLLEDVHSPKEL